MSLFVIIKDELLFYSNGNYVWNRDHEIMDSVKLSTYGSGLPASVLSLPVHGQDNRYYLFTMEESDIINVNIRPVAFYYSIIDKSLNDGKGGFLANERKVFIQDNLLSLMVAAKGSCGSLWLLNP